MICGSQTQIFPIFQDIQKISVGISEARANPNVRQDVRVVTELDKKQQRKPAKTAVVHFFIFLKRDDPQRQDVIFQGVSRCLQPGSFSSGCRRCHRRT